MRLTEEQLEAAEEKRIESLISHVKREAGVLVKRGKTNGRHCLHISKDVGSAKFPRGSYTIYSSADWESHPWNSEAKKEKRVNREAEQAVLSNR